MADRSFHRLDNQGIRHVNYNVIVQYTAGAPLFLEGDKVGAATGSYLKLVQSGTGVLTITTVDKFCGVVKCQAAIGMATPTGNAIVTQGKPTQNADGTWSVTINTWTNAAGTHTASTPLNGDQLNIDLVLRNSTSLP